MPLKTEISAHKWDRERNDHYVEEQWCSERLFQEIEFDKNEPIHEPCCGWGRIALAAVRSGYEVRASDLIDRRLASTFPKRRVEYRQLDFLGAHDDKTFQWMQGGSYVFNPPFSHIWEFCDRAVSLLAARRYAAVLCPVRRLAAGRKHLIRMPLIKVLYMTPRPSMPTGDHILKALAGEIDIETGKPYKVGGGQQDYCWLLFRKGAEYLGKTAWLTKRPMIDVPEIRRINRPLAKSA